MSFGYDLNKQKKITYGHGFGYGQKNFLGQTTGLIYFTEIDACSVEWTW